MIGRLGFMVISLAGAIVIPGFLLTLIDRISGGLAIWQCVLIAGPWVLGEGAILMDFATRSMILPSEWWLAFLWGMAAPLTVFGSVPAAGVLTIYGAWFGSLVFLVAATVVFPQETILPTVVLVVYLVGLIRRVGGLEEWSLVIERYWVGAKLHDPWVSGIYFKSWAHPDWIFRPQASEAFWTGFVAFVFLFWPTMPREIPRLAAIEYV